MNRLLSRLLVPLLVSTACLPLAAQQDQTLNPRRSNAPVAVSTGVPVDQDEFGTLDGNDLWLPVPGFTSRLATQTWAYQGNGYYSSTTGGTWEARIPLAKGNFLTGYRVYYSDTSTTNNISVNIYQYDYDRGTKAASTTIPFSFLSTGTPGPTDAFVTTSLTIDFRPPSTAIDRFYTIAVVMPGDVGVQFRGVRLFWMRQVSPAPATATYLDVPTTHAFFQYIEALSAAGITSGCGSGNFCPDAAVTRGQMAVFLAKALGLHWSP